jgi:hypothetical protein
MRGNRRILPVTPMETEFAFFSKYAPYYIPFLGALLLIIFTKNYLFRGMVSIDMHQAQIERERELIRVQESFSNRLEEIVKQLENLTKTVAEEIRANTERLHTIELVFSDNIDAVRELSINCEKHRKGIPDTEKFTTSRDQRSHG